jgi:hypothetical protein
MITITKVGSLVKIDGIEGKDNVYESISNFQGARISDDGTQLKLQIGEVSIDYKPFANFTIGGVVPTNAATVQSALATVFPSAAPGTALPTETVATYSAMTASIASDSTTKRDFFVSADETNEANRGGFSKYYYNGTTATRLATKSDIDRITVPGLPNSSPLNNVWAGSQYELNQIKSYLGTTLFWPGTVRYVSNSGNDSHDGLTPQTAWKTVAKVNATTLTAGTYVLFQRGGTWREALTIAQNGTSTAPITYGAYGVGLFPIISGADVITGFTSVSGTWDATVTTQPNIVLINGARANLKTSKAACTSVGDWFWTANTLTVNYPSDPSGLVESASRSQCVSGTGNYITLKNLIFTSNQTFTVYFTGNNKTINRCIFNKIGGRDQNGIGILASGSNNSITENIFIDIQRTGIANDGNPNSSATIAYNTFVNCWNQKEYNLGGNGGGIACSSTDSWQVYNNYVSGCYIGIDLTSAKNAVIHHNIVANSRVNDIAHQTAAVGFQCYVYNNTVIHNPSGTDSGHGIVTQNSGGYITIKNNLVYITFTGTNTNVQGICVASSAYQSVDIDYNLVYKIPGSTADLYKGDAIYSTLSTWQAFLSTTSFSGKEVHAKNADPLFRDYTNKDYSLLPSSPAISAGVNVGLSNGNTPNIGAL